MNSVIKNFGLLIVYPYVLSDFDAIKKALSQGGALHVDVLHSVKRVLSEDEALTLYSQRTLGHLLASGGGALEIASLHYGFQAYVKQIEYVQTEKVGIIAFNNVGVRDPARMRSMLCEKFNWDNVPWSVEYVTGVDAMLLKSLFPEEVWQKMERVATSFEQLSC